MRTIRLRNVTNEAKRISYKGMPIRFGPAGAADCQQDLPEAAARVCKEAFGDTLQIIGQDETSKSYVNAAERQEVWLANMTGDPDAPTKIKIPFTDPRTGEMQFREEDNPNAAPQTVSETLGARDEIYYDQHGKPWGRVVPGRTYHIPPYTRRAFPPAYAETFRLRDLDRPEAHRGRVIECRPPGDFEPDRETWSLQELRAYLMLIEPDWEKLVGPSESQIRSKAGKDEEKQYMALEAAKFLVWQRCILRLFNPKYHPPSKAEFEAFMARELGASKKSTESQEASLSG